MLLTPLGFFPEPAALSVVRRRPVHESPLVLKPRYVKDWTTLAGACIEIRLQGQLLESGWVDSVTDDGAILWLVNPAQIRKLYEKAEYCEAWVIEEPPASRDRGRKDTTP